MADLIKLEEKHPAEVQKMEELEARIAQLEVKTSPVISKCKKHPSYVGIDLIRALKCNTCLKIYADRTARKHVCGRSGYKKTSNEICRACQKRWNSVGMLITPRQKLME